MRSSPTLRRAVFAAATVAALGFGAAQALASPAAPADGSARRCDPEACQRRCAREGLFGFCDGRGCWCR